MTKIYNNEDGRYFTSPFSLAIRKELFVTDIADRIMQATNVIGHSIPGEPILLLEIDEKSNYWRVIIGEKIGWINTTNWQRVVNNTLELQSGGSSYIDGATINLGNLADGTLSADGNWKLVKVLVPLTLDMDCVEEL